MKKLLIILGILLSLTAVNATDWTIEGDKVYVDDSNVYISAEPHTITSSTWVEFTLTSKQYSGDIDVAFGFDSMIAKPLKAELYQPYTFNSTVYRVCYGDYFNWTWVAKSHADNQAWCWQGMTDNVTSWQELLWTDSFEWGNIEKATIYRNETGRVDYVDITNRFQTIEYPYQGVGRWYVLKNVNVNQGQEYKLQGYIQVPVKIGPSSGKYWVAVKPSSESISQAVSSGHFYFLDPWWDASWDYKVNDTHLSSVSYISDFPFLLNSTNLTDTSSSGMNLDSNCSSFRLINGSENTALSFEIVNISDPTYGCGQTKTEIWGKADVNNSGVNTFVYYRNNTPVAGISDPANVFQKDYLLVLHCHHNGSTNATNTSHQSQLNYTGMVELYNSDPKKSNYTDNGLFGSAVNFSSDTGTGMLWAQGSSGGYTDLTFEAWIYPVCKKTGSYLFADDKGGANSQDTGVDMKCGHDIPTQHQGRFRVFINNGVSKIYSTDKISINNGTWSGPQWHYIVAVFNQSGYYLYINGTLDNKSTDTVARYIGSKTILDIGNSYAGGYTSGFDGLMDEIRFSNVTRSEDYIKANWEQWFGNFSVLSPVSEASVANTSITNCSTGGDLIYNFTLVDEKNLSTPINYSMDATFFVRDVNADTNINYSFEFRDNWTYTICAHPDWEENMTMNATILHWREGIGEDYNKRTYYFYNASILNQATNHTLYNLNTTHGSRIIFTIKDAEGNLERDVYIKVQRYYPGNNTYRTVAIGKSDYLGQDIIYLELYDVWYKFILEKDGSVLQIIDAMRVVDTEITFTVEADGVTEWLKYNDKISYSCGYNNVTDNLVCTASDSSGYINVFCLNVTELTANRSSVLCESCDASSSVTLSCPVGDLGNRTVQYVLSAKTSFNPITWITVASVVLNYGLALGTTFGIAGVMITMMMGGTSAFIGLWRPEISIVLLVASLAGATIFGLITLSWSSIIGIALVGGVIIYKLRK